MPAFEDRAMRICFSFPIVATTVFAVALPVASGQPAAPEAGASAEAPPAAAMTFGEAIAYALEHNPDLVIAGQPVIAAERRIAAAKALRYPSLSVESNLFRWNEALVFDFEIPGMEPPPGMEIPPTTVRDQWTSTTTLTAAQPLTGLIALHYLVKAEKATLQAAEAELDEAQLEVAAQTGSAYLGALQARALLDVATESVAQIEAQLRQARALESAGALGKVDVMRLEAALAGVQQQRLLAEVAVQNADEALLLLMGLPLDRAFAPVDRFPDELEPPPIGTDAAVEVALRDRKDLRLADLRIDQAESGRGAARAELYPVVNAVASLQHNEGQGTFQANDSWFVGLTLSWTFWQWGSTWNEVQAAGAQVRAAELSADRLRERVALEVRALVRGAEANYKTLAVAETELAAAEEANRIQSVRFDQGAVTTTDLLVAQADVARARANVAQSRFEYLTSLVRLYRGLGALPREVITTSDSAAKGS